jgi:hypothetical protein
MDTASPAATTNASDVARFIPTMCRVVEIPA